MDGRSLELYTFGHRWMPGTLFCSWSGFTSSTEIASFWPTERVVALRLTRSCRQSGESIDEELLRSPAHCADELSEIVPTTWDELERIPTSATPAIIIAAKKM